MQASFIYFIIVFELNNTNKTKTKLNKIMTNLSVRFTNGPLHRGETTK